MNLKATQIMKKFLLAYPPMPGTTVADIGSMDVNGSYLELFPSHVIYTGIDIAAGNGVDVVSADPYNYPFPDNYFDLVISGNTMEHVEDMKEFMREVCRILKPGNLVFISVPFKWPKHRCPIDCWRVLPDGLSFLFKVSGIDPVEIKMIEDNTIYEGHTIGIGRKQI